MNSPFTPVPHAVSTPEAGPELTFCMDFGRFLSLCPCCQDSIGYEEAISYSTDWVSSGVVGGPASSAGRPRKQVIWILSRGLKPNVSAMTN